MKKNGFLTIVWLVGFSSIVFAAEPATMVRKGNRSYAKKDFDNALKIYNEAQVKAPERPEIDFDIGAAQYKKGDYKAAVSSFEKACAARDRYLEAKALYNIGNSKYKLGLLKENTDLSATVALLRESLDYYKRAIDLNPKDDDPKVNHELVEKQLKSLLDKLKQQGQKKQEEKSKEEKQEGEKQEEKNKEEKQQDRQQGQKEEKQEEKNKAQESQAEENKPEEKKGEEKQEEAKKPEENKPEEKRAQEKQAEEKKAEEEKQAQGEKQGKPEEQEELTEQEAKMLLDSYRQEEDNQGKLRDTGNRQTRGVDKDW